MEAVVTVISAAHIRSKFHPAETGGLVAEVNPTFSRESSTLRSGSGYLAYIDQADKPGELLQYRNGLVMAASRVWLGRVWI